MQSTFIVTVSRDKTNASRFCLGSTEREHYCPGARPALFDTGRQHGPAEKGERWYYGAAEWDGRRNPADLMGAR
jgi:hypothetical protein